MMVQVDRVMERSAQRRIARKYKTLGYEVLENPGPDLLPDFMRGVAPDIVARSSSDNVVIEVKQHASLKGSNDLVGIAERVSGHPDWRFKLVVVDEAENIKSNSDEDYKKLLEKVNIATSYQLFDMAFVYLVNVLVRTAHDLAKKSGIPTTKADRSLFLDLGFKGVLPNDLLELCLDALSTRNNLVHALDRTSPSADDVQSLLRLYEVLKQLL